MIKVVVFDLDETLINSKDYLIHYFRQMYAHLRIPFPEEKMELFYTLPEKGFLSIMFPDEATREQARSFRNNFNLQEHLDAISLKPHAAEAVRDLAADYRLAIATNRGPTTDAVLAHFKLTQYFEYVVWARTLAEPKPHPIVMQTIMEHFELSQEEIVMVGDSIIDVKTAAAVGARCIIVGDHAHNGLGDYQLEDLSDLADLVRGL